MALNTFSNGLRLVCVPKPEKKVTCVVLHIAGGNTVRKELSEWYKWLFNKNYAHGYKTTFYEAVSYELC